MTDDQIKHMVNRFLRWKLPIDFNPDCGITFERVSHPGTRFEHTFEPIGTNLFDAAQASAMVRHILEELPTETLGETDRLMAEFSARARASESIAPYVGAAEQIAARAAAAAYRECARLLGENVVVIVPAVVRSRDAKLSSTLAADDGRRMTPKDGGQ